MIKRTAIAAMLLVFSFAVKAQETPKKSSHYVSLQANPLIAQIFNFGNPIPIDNPYLLKYTYRGANRNSGIGVGFGFSSRSLDIKDGLSNKTSDLDFRAGYEWFVPMGKRFELSYGPDILFNGNNINTVNIQSFSFGGGNRDSTISTTKSQNISYGGGVRLNFSVMISPKILIGTEASFYWMHTDSKSKTTIENYTNNGFGEVYSFEEDEQESKSSSSNFNLPVAIFLTFRL